MQTQHARPVPALALVLTSHSSHSCYLLNKLTHSHTHTHTHTYTQGMDSNIAASITQPFPSPDPPGSVIADAGFTQFFGCQCGSTGEEGELRVVNGVAECKDDGDDHMHTRLIVAIVLVAVLPQLVLLLGIFIFVR